MGASAKLRSAQKAVDKAKLLVAKAKQSKSKSGLKAALSRERNAKKLITKQKKQELYWKGKLKSMQRKVLKGKASVAKLNTLKRKASKVKEKNGKAARKM